jgi:hypothetical protein
MSPGLSGAQSRYIAVIDHFAMTLHSCADVHSLTTSSTIFLRPIRMKAEKQQFLTKPNPGEP